MLILPVGDINPRRTAPLINIGLIVANIAAFVWVVYFAPHDQKERVVQTGLLVPNQWVNVIPTHWTPWRALFTSMFLHADLYHLGGNMLFLWVAGNSVEDRVGHLKYLVFYLLCGVAGAAVHIVLALGPMSTMAGVPTLGASGAISGVIGAYLVFFPKSKIKFMIWLILFIRYFTLPSWAVIGFWIGSQILMARQQFQGTAQGEQMTVAVFAHLGGFAFGVLWAVLARMMGKPPSKSKSD